MKLLREAALAFRRVIVERPGQPVNLPNKLSATNYDVRRYPRLDVLMSLGSGHPMMFQYDVSSADPQFEVSVAHANADALHLQWMHGCPGEFIVILARMHNIRDAPGYTVHTQEVDELEKWIRDWRPRVSSSGQPHLAVSRLAINECWRQTLLIYLFMGICRAGSDDVQVAQALKDFLKLIRTLQPSRFPDIFLLFPFLVAAVASNRLKDRNKIYGRVSLLRECGIANTASSDIVAMMINIWKRADLEGRPMYWADVKIAFDEVSGF
ncbi:Fungal specific transcription factor domain [Ceratobasidium sp. AG-Ba]|nr:Fungal specific transcription factor domain [Ceratobasidium sp. AG-Ba]